MKCMYKNPHCFGAACDSHSFGRKRRGGRKARGPRRSPARSLRAPSRGPIFHNLPGTTSQKIIAMGFDLGNGFPDMENYFRFLTSLSDAGLGYSRPLLAYSLNAGRMSYWSSANPSGPPVNPQPREIAIATNALWDYTDPDNWRLGKNALDPVPYRMQDVWPWYAMGGGAYGSGSYCNSNPCLRLEYLGKPGIGARQMPWSYVGTVQPGGRTRRRTRKGMVKFLRDYAKYIIAKGRPSLQQPASTKGLDPFQRKLQSNTFKAKRNRR